MDTSMDSSPLEDGNMKAGVDHSNEARLAGEPTSRAMPHRCVSYILCLTILLSCARCCAASLTPAQLRSHASPVPPSHIGLRGGLRRLQAPSCGGLACGRWGGVVAN